MIVYKRKITKTNKSMHQNGAKNKKRKQNKNIEKENVCIRMFTVCYRGVYDWLVFGPPFLKFIQLKEA